MKRLLLLSLIANVPAFSMNFDSPTQSRRSKNSTMDLPQLADSPRQSPQPKERLKSLDHEELIGAAVRFQERSAQNNVQAMERYFPTSHTKALQELQQKLYRLYKLTARDKDDSEYSLEAMVRSLSTDDAKSESLGRMLRCVDQLISDAQISDRSVVIKQQTVQQNPQQGKEAKSAIQRRSSSRDVLENEIGCSRILVVGGMAIFMYIYFMKIIYG